MDTPLVSIGIDQWFTFIGIIIALGMGILNYYDKRFPRKHLSPLEESQNTLIQNQAVDLANKRALDAETRADRAEEREIRLETLYNNLKTEFEEWSLTQSYKLVLMVQLGNNPRVNSSTIFHERRASTLPHDGEDRRK